MDVSFWLAQVIGIMGWLVLVFSYYRESTNKILVFHIVGNVMYALHYYLLGATSGVFICLLEVSRDYLYYKTDWDNYVFWGSIPVFVIVGLYNFTGWYDLLPIMAGVLDGFSLTKKKDAVVVGAIISYSMWIVYNISVLSISGIIADGLIVLSNLSILLFDFNFFDRSKKGKEAFIVKR